MQVNLMIFDRQALSEQRIWEKSITSVISLSTGLSKTSA